MKTIMESIISSLENAISNDFKDFDHCVGLCANVYYDLKKRQHEITPDRSGSFVGSIYGILQSSFPEWEYYSGSLGYPVPSHTGIDPMDQYRHCRKKGTMYSGEYGRKRKLLAMWVVSYLRNKL